MVATEVRQDFDTSCAFLLHAVLLHQIAGLVLPSYIVAHPVTKQGRYPHAAPLGLWRLTWEVGSRPVAPGRDGLKDRDARGGLHQKRARQVACRQNPRARRHCRGRVEDVLAAERLPLCA